MSIDEDMLMMEFKGDRDYHDPYDLERYIDLDTDSICLVYAMDHEAEMEGMSGKENEALRNEVKAHPERFLVIDGLSHAQHHQILVDFIESEPFDSEETRQRAKDAYYGRKSIGAWIKTVGPELSGRYFSFKEEAISRLMHQWAKAHGVEIDGAS